MAEQNPYAYDETTGTEPAPRGGLNVFTLIVGVATLLVSAYVLSDGASWLPPFDFRWVIAGGAVFVGLLLLGASFGGKRRR
ncbi:hypothetical protein AMES_0781 [Amycolatopsis mediterranei S699]|uniref:Integral membrane protein n=2 Tax=Amycolatopsis mediterranei TaxID=33910 RepID=A0A0H3CWB8_AMYMU|nr:hypothetical protein [Amycolatopsis mediterranei]ADJ42603.1 hypothetical protein AMED_0783 [Amycolatopsis mediterranei U32]AEK39292.1 hypothetical protein RAM_04000 [Amycolatopsis mediterranei S699]AFO74317.1 hypothetical protein AMES_0781 [Amycolatopsis mediterranei S699]AGT81446.1 hypothetical protein B737_0782 [Amycolatopsis mediterranei RB]KDO10097.1 hypothetical protein DV26_15575 [Amycolatopsis mediterranei]